MFQQVISNLESFVSKIKATPLNVSSHEIATAILLTGENKRCIFFCNCLTQNLDDPN